MKKLKSPLWFPYAQMKTMPEPLDVVGASGCCIELADGRKLIDGISSWWSVIHGYSHPVIVEAIKKQAETLSHVMLGGFTHQPARDLSETLVRITPQGLNHVFFSDSGSVAMEVALKMVVQYWRNKGNLKKSKFISLKKAYHGDTIGVMSISDPDEGFHHLFKGFVAENIFLPSPTLGNEKNDLHSLETILKTQADSIAGFVCEPIMQGAGGFNIYSADYLNEAVALCNAYDVLVIFDEIATGFGRLGTLFATEQTRVVPDILALGKGLTGGMLGLAATLATNKIYEAFLDDDVHKAFMHGPTFMGNPLACAAALASIHLFEKDHVLDRVSVIESVLKEELMGFSGKGIKEIRVKGAMAVIEVEDSNSLLGFRDYAISREAWLRPFDRFLYTMPPYIISESELRKICSVMKGFFGRKFEKKSVQESFWGA